jgi:hypothetical protein
VKLLEWIKQVISHYVMLYQARHNVAELFAKLYPEERGYLQFKKDEPDRFVFWVLYGQTRPPRFQFFYVGKNDLEAHLMEDNSNYRPEIWR